MRTVILAGGLGTRLGEITKTIPKPLVAVSNEPLIRHVMRTYERFHFAHFTLALGYKAHLFKEYFEGLLSNETDVSVDLSTGKVTTLYSPPERSSVDLINTGLSTLTGGRLKRLQRYISEPEFMLTYGDGIGYVDIPKLISFHKKMDRIATVTCVRPPARFGEVIFRDGLAISFDEKPQVTDGWINGGYFVFKREIFDYIAGDNTNLEKEVLPRLAKEEQLACFEHEGFWQCVDTPRDISTLESHLNPMSKF